MRVPLRKLWRAFPELDRFSDEQCRKFIAAADRHVVIRTIACLIAGPVIGVTSWVALAWAVDRFGELIPGTLTPAGEWTIATLALLLTFSLLMTFLAPLRLRDWAVRRGVRHTIDSRGTCAQCRYVLLGLKVGPDLSVRCPECGGITIADVAMGELVAEDDATQTFRPSIRFEDPAVTARRRKRWRAIRRTAHVTCLSAAAGLLLWSAVLGVQSSRDASRARAGRHHLDDYFAQLPDARLQEEARDAREALIELLGRFETIQEKAPLLTVENVPSSAAAKYLQVRSSSFWEVLPEHTRASIERYVDHCADENLFRRCVEHVDVRWYLGGDSAPVVGTFERTWERVSLASNASLFFAFDGARGGNLNRFLEGVESVFCLARFADHALGPYGGDLPVMLRDRAYAQLLADAPNFPDDSWIQAAADLLNRQAPAIEQRREHLKYLRARHLDFIGELFSDPKTLRQRAFNLGLRFRPGSVGRYDANIAALNAIYDEVIDQLALPPFQRRLPLTSSYASMPIVEAARIQILEQLRKDDAKVTQAAGVRVALAIERHIVEHGRPPASLSELTPAMPNRIDPFSGKEFLYQALEPRAIESHGVRRLPQYSLYSVGPNGIDDGRQSAYWTFLDGDLIIR